jgi:hypothetical protein
MPEVQKLTTDPYKALIAATLQARGSLKDDFTSDPVHREARYVVRMCEQVRDLIVQRGGSATLEAVMRAERCASGHVDYHAKFAFYSAELEVGLSPLAA